MLNNILIFFIFINSVYSFSNINFNNNLLKLKKTKLLSFQLPNIPTITIENNNYNKNTIQTLRYSEFLNAVETQQIDKTLFYNDNKKILAIDKDNNKYKLNAIPNDNQLLDILNKNNVDIIIQENDINKKIINYIFSYLVISLIVFTLLNIFINNNSNNTILNNSNNIKIYNNITVSFNDVIGIDNSKKELEEIVDFLKNSDKYTKLGAYIPRGVILEGLPGTGKTLLAKAVAGEAKVPFFYISGSEFIEMYVGTGASRVRTLFQTAKNLAPCIIFIDEIDSIGKQRGNNNDNSNSEKDQTLNQLLTEMDGFENNNGIIVIAATNRGDILDKALLRPGRFDRKVFINLPDYKGRIEILKFYSKDKKINNDIDYNIIASRTSGFSGAELANLMNEAAILTVRNNLTSISNIEISNAFDKITLGPLKKNIIRTIKNKELIAYHEAGHAIVAALIKNYDTVTKITISPRGNSGGLTLFAPNEETLESGFYSRNYLKSIISVSLGGRIAEEIIFGENEITTGASNDLQRVTSIARQMIMEYGMSDILGNYYIDKNKYISHYTRTIIDNEVNLLVNDCYLYSKKLLLNNIDLLHNLAKLLVQKNTITQYDFYKLIDKYNK